jgi:hypothetical protein
MIYFCTLNFFLFWIEFSIQDLNIMMLRVCGCRAGLTLLTALNKIASTGALIQLSVSPLHPHHSVTIHHFTEAHHFTETTFMNISLQVALLLRILLTAVGHTQLPETVTIIETDLLALSPACALNTPAPELNACCDLQETGI